MNELCGRFEEGEEGYSSQTRGWGDLHKVMFYECFCEYEYNLSLTSILQTFLYYNQINRSAQVNCIALFTSLILCHIMITEKEREKRRKNITNLISMEL